jgi:hypothetical protein
MSSYLQNTLRMMPRLAPASRPVGPFKLSTQPIQVAQNIVYIRKRPILSFHLVQIPLLSSTFTGRLYLLRKDKKIPRIRGAVYRGEEGEGVWSQIDDNNNAWDSFNLFSILRVKILSIKHLIEENF